MLRLCPLPARLVFPVPFFAPARPLTGRRCSEAVDGRLRGRLSDWLAVAGRLVLYPRLAHVLRRGRVRVLMPRAQLSCSHPTFLDTDFSAQALIFDVICTRHRAVHAGSR